MPNRHPQCVASLNRPRRGRPLGIVRAAAPSASSVEQAQAVRRASGPCLGGCPVLQPQVGQDLLDDLRVLDGGDDLHPPTAVLALLNVDREHVLQTPRPVHPHRRGRPAHCGTLGLRDALITPRHDLGAQAMNLKRYISRFRAKSVFTGANRDKRVIQVMLRRSNPGRIARGGETLGYGAMASGLAPDLPLGDWMGLSSDAVSVARSVRRADAY